MKSDVNQWLEYASDNFATAEICLTSHIYNPCLQNCQQAIEKWLKSLMLLKDIPVKKTHKIKALIVILENNDIHVSITDYEITLIDSILIPSKYPADGIYPDFEPDAKLCRTCIEIADKVRLEVERLMG